MVHMQEVGWLILTFYLLSFVIMGWHIMKQNPGLCPSWGPLGFTWLRMAEDSYEHGPEQKSKFTSNSETFFVILFCDLILELSNVIISYDNMVLQC